MVTELAGTYSRTPSIHTHHTTRQDTIDLLVSEILSELFNYSVFWTNLKSIHLVIELLLPDDLLPPEAGALATFLLRSARSSAAVIPPAADFSPPCRDQYWCVVWCGWEWGWLRFLLQYCRAKVVADTWRNAILSTTQYSNALMSLVLQDSPARVM